MTSSHALDEKHQILLIDPYARQHNKSLAASLKECKIIVNTEKSKSCDFFLHNEIDLVLLDHSGKHSCTELLQFFKSVKPSVPVIILTDCGSEELAVTVFRFGARDYFRKPLAMQDLKKSILRALCIKEVLGEEELEKPWNGLFRAIRYINERYTFQIKLSEIARESGMSISCFGRTFKREMGITFTLYVNRLRISKAIKMLRENGLSMSDIAFACGFTNQFHFTRMFKRIMKASPRVYKKSLRKKKSPLSHFKHLCKEKPKGYSLN